MPKPFRNDKEGSSFQPDAIGWLSGVARKDFDFNATLENMKQFFRVRMHFPWTGPTRLRPEHAHMSRFESGERRELHFLKFGYVFSRIEDLVPGHVSLPTASEVIGRLRPGWR